MIDAHHHFWRYNSLEYDWIGESWGELRRDFLPSDLKIEIEKAGVAGVVSVQARQTIEETRALLQFAAQNDWILGVVGWLPLAAPELDAALEEFASQPALKAVRHVVQGEPDGFLSGNAFNRGIAKLRSFGLSYDVLIFERQLPETIAFVDRHPNQIFVLDHIAKPRIQNGEFEFWRTHIDELARRDNVFCKVSGMVTEADWKTWTPQSLAPYFEAVLAAFGASRLMFGSDWPVCLLASGYSQWVQTVSGWVDALSEAEKRDLFESTARRAYQLDAEPAQ